MNNLTVKELREKAKTLGLKGYAKATKNVLISMINEAQVSHPEKQPFNENDVILLYKLLPKSEVRKMRKEFFLAGNKRWASIRVNRAA